jgi:hypothetical protein
MLAGVGYPFALPVSGDMTCLTGAPSTSPPKNRGQIRLVSAVSYSPADSLKFKIANDCKAR